MGLWGSALTALLVLTAAAAACGGVSVTNDAGTCTPNQSIACTGAGGCAGGQVCNASGTAFSDCDCGNLEGGLADGAPDAAPDASDTSTEDAAVVNPASVSGLVLWLDSDKGIIGGTYEVSGWTDQSSNHNDATQTDGSRYCYLHANAINGHSSVKFPPGDFLYVPDNASLQFGTGNFTTITVLEPIPNIDPILVFAKLQNGVGWESQVGDNYEFYLGTDSDVMAPITASKFHVVTTRATATEVRVDGVSTTGSASSYDVSAVGAHLMIGSGNGTDPNMGTMEIAEVLMISGILSNADVAGLEAYERLKFGL